MEFTYLYVSGAIVLFVFINWFALQSTRNLRNEINDRFKFLNYNQNENVSFTFQEPINLLAPCLDRWKFWYSKLSEMFDGINRNFGFLVLSLVSFTFLTTIIQSFYLVNFLDQFHPFQMFLQISALTKYIAYLMCMAYVPQKLKSEVIIT